MRESLIGKVELALDARASLAETPVWDERRARLFWVDIDGNAIHCFDPAAGADLVMDTGCKACAAALRADGGLIAALQDGFYRVDFPEGEIRAVARPEADRPGNRFNDGQCDPAGRFWAGTIDMNTPRQPVGTLYVLDRDLSVRPVLTGVTTSNGMAWSLDRRTMYYIDTRSLSVDALDYDLATGQVGNRHPIITFAPGGGRPDGMTIDAEGMLWIALWDGWQVGRFDPATGRQLATVPIPAQRVSSCAFGGPDLDWLYVTTARGGLSEADLANQPHAGGIFRVRTVARGLPANRFRG